MTMEKAADLVAQVEDSNDKIELFLYWEERLNPHQFHVGCNEEQI